MRHLLIAVLLSAGLAKTALAGAPAAPGVESGEPAAPEADAPKGVWERDTLTGDWGGFRTRLNGSGIQLTAKYIGDGLANVSGGLHRGAVYAGLFHVGAELDLERLAGLAGASIYADAFQIHGRGLSSEFLGNLLATSNIEAHRATRLHTLWFQQNWMDDRLSIRLGQIAADDEFILSDTAGTFINGTFGWMPLAANNLPGGGPGYPLAAPGVRLAAVPVENLTFRAAVLAGNPAGDPGAEDPQVHDCCGTTFSLEGGVLAISEIEYAAKLGALPGSYKIGGWYHSGVFDDLRFDDMGLSLADPASTGVPRRHRGTYALYAIADQAVYREPGGADRGLNLFLRIGGAPSDVNPIDFYVDGGGAYTGLIPGRDGDTLGIAVGYARVSGDLQGLDRDHNAFSGAGGPVEDSETVLELTYIAQLTPWWSLQPDAQFVFHPGGNVPDPSDPASAVPDAVVLGLRSSIFF